MKKKVINIIFVGADIDDCIRMINGVYHAVDGHWGLCNYLLSSWITRKAGEVTFYGENSGNTAMFRSVQCDVRALHKAYEAVRNKEGTINYDKVLNAMGLSKTDLRRRTIFVDIANDPRISALMEMVLGLYKELSAPFALIHGVNIFGETPSLKCTRGQLSAKIVLDYKIAPEELESEKEFRSVAENFFSSNEQDVWLEVTGHLFESVSALLCA